MDNIKLDAWRRCLSASRLPITIFCIGFVFSLPQVSTAQELQTHVLEAVIDKGSLETHIYKTKHALPELLMGMADHIMHAVVQDQPFRMVCQPSSHEILIESTPDLNVKATAILAYLDDPTKNGIFQFEGLLSSVDEPTNQTSPHTIVTLKLGRK